MSRWFLIRARRIRIASDILYLLLAIAVLINIIDLFVHLPGDYRPGLLLVPLVPGVIFLTRYHSLRALPNLLAVAMLLAYVGSSLLLSPAASITMIAFVVAPMVFFFLTNLYLGSLLSGMLLAIFILSLMLHGHWHSAGSMQGLSVYLLVGLLAWLYERDWLAIESRLLVNSDIDFLTQIHNRRGLMRMLQRAMADALRHRHELAVIMFEVEAFDELKERHGQHACDQMLIQLAGLLSRHIRGGDCMGRWDRQQFMILAPNTELSGAAKLAEKLRRLLKSYYFETIGHIDANLGAVKLQHDSIESLLDKVQGAMQAARRQGGAVVVEGS